jgi:hypothetical protein
VQAGRKRGIQNNTNSGCFRMYARPVGKVLNCETQLQRETLSSYRKTPLILAIPDLLAQ